MTDIQSKIHAIYAIEQLAQRKTGIHLLHPCAKIIGTVVYIVCVVSSDRYVVSALMAYLLYPVLVMALAEIPYGMIGKRLLLALPFCLFAGVSDLLFDRAPVLYLGAFAVSGGMLSCGILLLRTLLCVAAVLILVAVTPFSELTGQLRRMHVPRFLVLLFEMTYRYVGTLIEETASMYIAYGLRSRTKKGLDIRHMGSFVGQLLLRSFDRAERIYQAMQCRGYALAHTWQTKRRMQGADYAFLALVCGSSVWFHFINLARILGRMLSC